MADPSGGYVVVWTTLGPDEIPPDQHARAAELYAMAVAEAGYPINPKWSEREGCYLLGNVPEHVHHRAQRLVYEAMGWPYAQGAAW